MLVLWGVFRSCEENLTKVNSNFTQTFASPLFYLNTTFVFYIEAYFSLMEVNHYPFDRDILKNIPHPSKASPTVSLWICWLYPSDTVCRGREETAQFYQTVDSLVPTLSLQCSSDRWAPCQRLWLFEKNIRFLRNNPGRINPKVSSKILLENFKNYLSVFTVCPVSF